MPKPTTEELILKELRTIRGLLERFDSQVRASKSVQTQSKPEPRARAPAPHMKIMGIDQDTEQRR